MVFPFREWIIGIQIIRFFPTFGQGIHDSFLEILCGVIIVSDDFNFIIGGNS